MQVSPVSRPAPQPPQRDPTRQTLVAGLLLSLTPPMAPFDADRTDPADELQARREQSIERRQSATQADRQSVTQTLRDRERRMRPGSHAFRQALRREQRFRDVAAEPRPRPSAPGPRPTPAGPPDHVSADAQPPRSETPRPAPASRLGTDAPVDPPARRPAVTGPTTASAPAERATRPGPNLHSSSPAPQPRPAAAPLIVNTRVVKSAAAAATPAARGRAAGGPPASRVEPAPLVNATLRDRTSGARILSTRARAEPTETRAQQERRIERIVRVVRHSLQAGQTRTTLRLDPPALGKLRIDIQLHDSSLHLRFEPAHELAHRLLSRQIEELAAALRATGLEPQRIDIQPAAGPSPNGTNPDAAAHHGGGGATGGHPHAAPRTPDATVSTEHDDARNGPLSMDAPETDGVRRNTMAMVNVWA